MTRKEAKDLSLEVWRYLAAHPGVRRKSDMPEELYAKVEDLRSRCPLCELFAKGNCSSCPLFIDGRGCTSNDRPFDRWSRTGFQSVREDAAEEIVRQIEAWEVEDE